MCFVECKIFPWLWLSVNWTIHYFVSEAEGCVLVFHETRKKDLVVPLIEFCIRDVRVGYVGRCRDECGDSGEQHRGQQCRLVCPSNWELGRGRMRGDLNCGAGSVL